MLVSANDGAIDVMQTPVEFPIGIGVLLKIGQDTVPNTRSSPAIEAGGNRLPGAVLLG
jgi:hypothetical protein